jgi:hypothetical protein
MYYVPLLRIIYLFKYLPSDPHSIFHSLEALPIVQTYPMFSLSLFVYQLD